MTTLTDWSDRYPPEIMQGIHEASLEPARLVVPLVLDALPQVRSVVDVGCGLGTWAAAFELFGVDPFGIDGPWIEQAETVLPPWRFLVHDLREPFRRAYQFDLCLCLEVAEHLPSECANTIVDTVTSLAPTVFWSAAIPGQGGHHHENEQPPEYWAEKFAARGYLSRELPGLAELPLAQWPWYQRARLFERTDA